MAISYVGTVFAHGSDDGTNAWPTHAIDDCGFLFVETRVTESAPPTPSGWTLIGHDTSAATGVAQARGSVFWRRATSTSETAAAINTGVVDHWSSKMYVVRGLATSVSPVIDFAFSSRSGTSGAFAGWGTVTSTVDGQFILHGIMAGNNKSVSGWADSDLASITEITASLSSIGSDSTQGAAYGVDTTAGDVGPNTTVTIDAALVACTLVLGEEPAGGTDTPVALAAGSFALTGNSTTVTRGLLSSLAAGSFSLTGNSTTLTRQVPVSLDAGSFTLTGLDTTITRQLYAPLDVASFSLTGNDLSVTASLTSSLDAGSFSFTGFDTTIVRALPVSLASTSFVFTGHDPTVTRQLSAALDATSFSLSGYDLTSTVQSNVSLAAGSFTLTGNDTSITRALTSSLDAGSFSLTGYEIGIGLVNASISLDLGTFSLTGYASDISRGTNLPISGNLSTAQITGVTVSGSAIVSVTGSGMTASLGVEHTWSHILPDQNPTWVVVDPTQVASWSDESPSQSPNWTDTLA